MLDRAALHVSSIPEEGGSATGVHITDMSQWSGGDAGPTPFEQVRSGFMLAQSK
jgi:hypothetical protein